MEAESPRYTYQSSHTASPVPFQVKDLPKVTKMGLPNCSIFSKISQMENQYSPFHVYQFKGAKHAWGSLVKIDDMIDGLIILHTSILSLLSSPIPLLSSVAGRD